MSSPFMFPSGAYSDPRETYYNMYSNYASRTPQYDPEAFLDPTDPELVNLRNLYARPTGSADLYRNYVSSMPTPEDYQPTTGTRIGGFLLGALGGGGYKAARSFIDEPYAEAYRQWADEGKFIDDQSRLIEADRAREIKATEFGIRQKALAAQRADVNRRFGEGMAARITSGQLTEEERARRNADRDESRRLMDEARKAGLDISAERLGLERDRLELARSREGAKADSLVNRAKGAKAYADLLNQAKGDVVKHPQFKQYFKQVVNKTTGEVEIQFVGPPEIKPMIDNFIKARLRNYQLGNTPTEGGF